MPSEPCHPEQEEHCLGGRNRGIEGNEKVDVLAEEAFRGTSARIWHINNKVATQVTHNKGTIEVNPES